MASALGALGGFSITNTIQPASVKLVGGNLDDSPQTKIGKALYDGYDPAKATPEQKAAIEKLASWLKGKTTNGLDNQLCKDLLPFLKKQDVTLAKLDVLFSYIANNSGDDIPTLVQNIVSGKGKFEGFLIEQNTQASKSLLSKSGAALAAFAAKTPGVIKNAGAIAAAGRQDAPRIINETRENYVANAKRIGLTGQAAESYVKRSMEEFGRLVSDFNANLLSINGNDPEEVDRIKGQTEALKTQFASWGYDTGHFDKVLNQANGLIKKSDVLGDRSVQRATSFEQVDNSTSNLTGKILQIIKDVGVQYLKNDTGEPTQKELDQKLIDKAVSAGLELSKTIAKNIESGSSFLKILQHLSEQLSDSIKLIINNNKNMPLETKSNLELLQNTLKVAEPPKGTVPVTMDARINSVIKPISDKVNKLPPAVLPSATTLINRVTDMATKGPKALTPEAVQQVKQLVMNVVTQIDSLNVSNSAKSAALQDVLAISKDLVVVSNILGAEVFEALIENVEKKINESNDEIKRVKELKNDHDLETIQPNSKDILNNIQKLIANPELLLKLLAKLSPAELVKLIASLKGNESARNMIEKIANNMPEGEMKNRLLSSLAA